MNTMSLQLIVNDDQGQMLEDEITINTLSKREQFAMAAMQGLLSDLAHHYAGQVKGTKVAADCVMLADALIKELDKGKDNDQF